ncbi:Ankyrin repeat domain-containing protein 7 [Blomia tropicalis]|nr:Ankyrin repeat domain-containing protein 7 [Blomia tropicalis]
MKKLFENVHRRLSSSSSGTNAFSIRRLSMTSNISLGGLSTLQIKVLRGGYNIDLEKVDSKFTKLHKAVYLNNEDKVRQYLSMQTMKYDVNSVDSANRTALHYAAVNGNGNIVTMLINHGAKVNIQDSDGRTPMIKAIECGHTNVLQLLMQSGADIDLADREHGNTALHHALISSELDCALYIIRNALEIDYNKRNHRKETFLHLAVKIVDLYPVIEELIANGIEIDAIDELGRSAAQVAQLHLNDEAYRIIMKYSIPNNVKRFDSNDSSLSFDYENNEEIMMLTTTATTATTATTTNTTTINDGKTETVEVHKVQDCSNHQLLSIIEEGSSSAKNSASSSNESNGKLIKHESINVIEDDTIYENCRVMDHEEEEEQELEQEQEEEEVVEVNEQFQSKSIDDEIDEMSSILNNMSSLDQMLQEGMNTDLIVQSTMKPMDEETRLAAIAINSNNLSKKEKRSSRSDWLELIGNSDSSSSLSSPINNSKTIVKTINHEMTNNRQTIAQQPAMATSTPIPVTPTKPTKTFAQVVASPPSRHTIIPSSPTKVNSNNSNNNHHQRNVNNKNKSNGNNWKQGKNGRSSSSSFSSSPDHSGGPGSPIKSCTVSPDYKRKEVHLLKQTIDTMQKQIENDQNYCRQLEEKITSMGKQQNQMDRRMGVNHNHQRLSIIDIDNDDVNKDFEKRHSSLKQSDESENGKQQWQNSDITPNYDHGNKTHQQGSLKHREDPQQQHQQRRQHSSASNTPRMKRSNKLGMVHNGKRHRQRSRSNLQSDYSSSFSYKSKYFQHKINELRMKLGINNATTFR